MDRISHDLVNEFLHELKDRHGDNGDAYFLKNGGYFSNSIYRIMEIMFNSFLEARAQVYDTDKGNHVTIDTETAGETVKKIHALYRLFKGIDSGNKQLAELIDTFGEFCKIIEVREFIFNEIMQELKSLHILRSNKEDVYNLLSAMDSDYIFKYGYLRNHNMSRKLFDDIFKRVAISTGNSHTADDNEKENE